MHWEFFQEVPHPMFIENFSLRTPIFFPLESRQVPNSLIMQLKLWEKRDLLINVHLPKLMQDFRKPPPWFPQEWRFFQNGNWHMDFPSICWSDFFPSQLYFMAGSQTEDVPVVDLGQAFQLLGFQIPHRNLVSCMSSLHQVLHQGERTPCVFCPLSVNICASHRHFYHALNFGTRETTFTACCHLLIYT